MPTAPTYQSPADAVLLLHLAVVGFVVGGLALVFVGNLRGWKWANNFYFRVAHLAAIGIVVLQSWLGQDCPLTVLESWLRYHSGGGAYQASFIQHWVHRVLFYEAPLWVFALIYSLFGLLVVATWWYFPPNNRTQYGQSGAA